MATAIEQRDENVIDLTVVFMRLWAARGWIVASVMVFTAVFTAWAFLSTRIYSSSTVFVSSSDRASLGDSVKGSLGGLASLAGLNLGAADAEMQEGLAVLKSREFTEAFIRDRDLMPKLFPDAWDGTTKSWKPNKRTPTPAKAYKYFNTKVRTIIESKKTGLIELRIEWRDRAEAAAWANELLQRLNEEMRRRAIVKADAALGYLERESQSTPQVETRAAISRLIEAQVKQRMLANVTPDYAFRVVDRAMPADASEPVKPKVVLLLIAGPLVGFAVGALGVLICGWVSRMLRVVRGS